eukprot:scaffold5358_cov68-Phaeocystis_antarctica.AAC.4
MTARHKDKQKPHHDDTREGVGPKPERIQEGARHPRGGTGLRGSQRGPRGPCDVWAWWVVMGGDGRAETSRQRSKSRHQ